MNRNINNFPYFLKTNNQLKRQHEKKLADFLSKKFKPGIKEKFPQHYLIQPIQHKQLNAIKKHSIRLPYFLRFDIRLYYPSIDHQILIQKIPEIYEKISKRKISRRFRNHLEKDIPEILNHSPYKRGLSLGSPLSHILSGIFLLDLDLEIPYYFLRQTDDYLVFCEKKNDPEKIIKDIVIPKITELKLEINEKKLSSGKFHRDKVDFIGFNFYAGHFTIKESKKEEFKRKILNTTHLTIKKSEQSVIKKINDKILGFGHYYKFASCRNDFKELDAFTRMRLRRYISRNKDRRNREGNLYFTNSLMESMGLKSLTRIKDKYALKKHPIPKKKSRKRKETNPNKKIESLPSLEEKAHFYEQKQILDELRKLTSLIRRLKTEVTKMNRKLPK